MGSGVASEQTGQGAGQAQPASAVNADRPARKAWNPYRDPRFAAPAGSVTRSYQASATSSTVSNTRAYVTKTQAFSITGSSTSTPVGGASARTSRTRGATVARASVATAAVHPDHRRISPTQRVASRSTCPDPGRTARHWALKWSVALAALATGSAAAVKAVVLSPASAKPLAGPAAPARCGSALGETPCSWWRGINLYSGFSDQLGSADSTAAVNKIVAGDANNYVVYVPELNTAADGTVSIGSRAISDGHLIQAGEQTAAGGAAAVLKPHISDPTDFAGGPGFVSSYSSVLEHYGQVATQMKAKVFVIATELTRIYRDPAAMNSLIDAAESTYHVPGGQIAVAINWDQLHEALSFPWLSRITLVGVDGYWPLGSGGAASVNALYDQWQRSGEQTDGTTETPGDAVAGLAGTGRQVVFTEIGYQDCQGSAADPSAQPDPSNSSSCGASTTDPRTQRAATEAAYCYWTDWARRHGDPSWFHGLWWWDWDLSQSANVWDVKSGAESVIRSWNTGAGGECPSA